MILTEKNQIEKKLSEKDYFITSRSTCRDVYSTPIPGESLAIFKDQFNLFGFELGDTIPRKGEFDTALNHFWVTSILPQAIGHNLIKSTNNAGYNKAYDLDLPSERCLIIKPELNDYPYEIIFRQNLDDDIYQDYLKNKKYEVCGHKLLKDIKQWDMLDGPIFTPMQNGKNITVSKFFTEMNIKGNGNSHDKIVDSLYSFFSRAQNLAQKSGFYILKTKFQISESLISGNILNSNSTVFCEVSEFDYAIEENREPESFVNEYLLDWSKSVKNQFCKNGINNLDPNNQQHQNFVHQLKIPKTVIDKTYARFLYLFEKLTGDDLNLYQENQMGITRIR